MSDQLVRLGTRGLGTRTRVPAAATGGAYAVVEHDLPARQLGSPVHTHTHEDECSFVLEGTMTVLVGDEEREVGAGEVVVKPRGVPHAFWNASDAPVRFVELITPGGFEEYFPALAGPFAAQDPAGMGEVMGRFGLDVRPETIGELSARHGLEPPF